MKALSLILIAGALCAAGAARAGVLEPLKVTFQTTECNGDTGMASVDVDRIERIQSIDCDNGRKLRQVLVRPAAGAGLQVHSVTPEASADIERQIKQYMETRRKTLEGSKPILINP
jgi:hypothetical protein